MHFDQLVRGGHFILCPPHRKTCPPVTLDWRPWLSSKFMFNAFYLRFYWSWIISTGTHRFRTCLAVVQPNRGRPKCQKVNQRSSVKWSAFRYIPHSVRGHKFDIILLFDVSWCIFKIVVSNIRHYMSLLLTLEFNSCFYFTENQMFLWRKVVPNWA